MVRFIVECNDINKIRRQEGNEYALMYKLANGPNLYGILSPNFFVLIWYVYQKPLEHLHQKLWIDGYNSSYRFYDNLTKLELNQTEKKSLYEALCVEVIHKISLRNSLTQKIINRENICLETTAQFIVDRLLLQCNLICREQYFICNIKKDSTGIKGFDSLTTASDESVLKAFFYLKLHNHFVNEIETKEGFNKDIWEDITKAANKLFYVSLILKYIMIRFVKFM
jgi:hypothetical protein